MKLKELLRDLPSATPIVAVDGSTEIDIADVRDDSRAVESGDLFVALPGQHADGHAFLKAAHERGAVACLVEKETAAADFPGTRVRVGSTVQALAHVAARRFGDPARAMRMVAVTGTNGKTTTTFLVESILRAAGHKPGVIGTVSYRYDGKSEPASLTTPTALELHGLLARMRAAGCTHVVMETSSHALELGRLDGIRYRVGAFTNLTQDHLDFHGTMDAYFVAKSKLFRQLLVPSEGVGVIFLDGGYGRRMASCVVGERMLVSLTGDDADVYPQRATTTIDGIEADLSSPLGLLRVRSRLIGQYNLANIVVAVGVAMALGVDLASIQRGITELEGVPGRVERVKNQRGLDVFVDYAHTHDALENVLAALRPLTKGRLLCVFGCGGDRDRRKRPLMGKAVARDADLAFVTSDNPRTEEPGAIVEMILEGVRETDSPRLDAAALATAKRGHYVEVDRRAAIGAAVAAMQQGDVLLIAGKGHEDYQIIGTTKHPFDDRLVAKEAIDRRAPVAGAGPGAGA